MQRRSRKTDFYSDLANKENTPNPSFLPFFFRVGCLLSGSGHQVAEAASPDQAKKDARNVYSC